MPSASSLPSLVPPLPVLGAPQNPPTPKFIFVAGFFIVVATILGIPLVSIESTSDSYTRGRKA